MTKVINHYEELISRNWGFLAPDEQLKVKNTRILFAGCGLGSNIAVLAARTGFTSFVVADGDSVELSNLNRQAFRSEHRGINKAEATAVLIREIIPEAKIEIVPRFITDKDAHGLVENVELIVNTVDPGSALFALNSEAQAQGKIVFFPLNIGYGGLTMVFTADSFTLEEMLGGEVAQGEVFLRLIEKAVTYFPHISGYTEKFADKIEDILKGILPGPQLGIAANINSSLIVTGMLKSILGIPLTVAPEPLFLDAWLPDL